MHGQAMREVVDEAALAAARVAEQHQPALLDGGLERTYWTGLHDYLGSRFPGAGQVFGRLHYLGFEHRGVEVHIDLGQGERFLRARRVGRPDVEAAERQPARRLCQDAAVDECLRRVAGGPT